MTRLARWRRMSAFERHALAEAVLLMPLVGASLRISGFRRTYHRLEQSPVRPAGDPAEVDAVAEAVALTSHHLPLYRPTCLPRSLVLWRMLRRRGLDAELCIGVRSREGQMTAHAWVEHDGQVLNDVPDIAHRFAPLDLPHAFLANSWS